MSIFSAITSLGIAIAQMDSSPKRDRNGLAPIPENADIPASEQVIDAELKDPSPKRLDSGCCPKPTGSPNKTPGPRASLALQSPA
jgi:hypothetical protein